MDHTREAEKKSDSRKQRLAGNSKLLSELLNTDMKLVEELFPRTIVMDEGLVVADGKTKEVLAEEKFLNEHGLEKP